MIQLGLNIFLKFADENFVVCFSVVKELKHQSQLQQATFINIFSLFLEKIRLDVMKNQALFSSKDKSRKLKCRLLQFFVCFTK